MQVSRVIEVAVVHLIQVDIYLEVKTRLFDKRPRKFSPSFINARSRAVTQFIQHIVHVYRAIFFTAAHSRSSCN